MSTTSDKPAVLEGLATVPAATVIIFRDAPIGPPQLLMVQRAKEMRFAGGAAVFPGGKVDPADRVLAAELMPHDDQEIAAARIAAIRETLEETGLVVAIREAVTAEAAAQARKLLLAQGTLATVLETFGWTMDPDRLTLYTHWCPPWDGAFDTRFFIVNLGTGAVDIEIDATENTRLFWASAEEALGLAERGEIKLIFPTVRNLERLAQHGKYADVLQDLARHPVAMIIPRRTERDGEAWIEIEEGRGYPVLSQRAATARRG